MVSPAITILVVIFLAVYAENEEKRFLFDSVTKPVTHSTSSLPRCKSSYADIAFFQNTRKSTSKSDFVDQKKFIINFIYALDVGPHQAQISSSILENHDLHIFFLNQYDNKREILNEIASLPYSNSDAPMAIPFVAFRDAVFQQNHGDRRTAPNFAIILTDGQFQYASETALAAKQLRDDGVKIFAIGIGDNVSEDGLLKICGDRKYLFHVSSYNLLGTIQQALDTLFCEAIAGTKCDDKIQNCHEHMSRCLYKFYRPWAEENCPAFCGFCKRTNTTTTLLPTTTVTPQTTPPTTTIPSSTPGLCINTINNCDAYGTIVCTTFKNWSTKNCPLYCHFCSGTTTPLTVLPTSIVSTASAVPTTHPSLFSANSCKDKVTSCQSYGPSVCSAYHDWAVVQCPKFCGVCKATTTLPTTKSTSLPTKGVSTSLKTAITVTTGTSMTTATFITPLPPSTTQEISTTRLSRVTKDATTQASLPSILPLNATTNGHLTTPLPSRISFSAITTAKPSTLANSRETTSTTVAPFQKCEDKIKVCDRYGRDICVNLQAWAAVQCAKFCGFCQDKQDKSTLQPTTTATLKTSMPQTTNTTALPLAATAFVATTKSSTSATGNLLPTKISTLKQNISISKERRTTTIISNLSKRPSQTSSMTLTKTAHQTTTSPKLATSFSSSTILPPITYTTLAASTSTKTTMTIATVTPAITTKSKVFLPTTTPLQTLKILPPTSTVTSPTAVTRTKPPSTRISTSLVSPSTVRTKMFSSTLQSTIRSTKTVHTPPPLLSGGTCRDDFGNCAAYGLSVCTNYRDWSIHNCASFCGFCHGYLTPPPLFQGKCSDNLPTSRCESYGPEMCYKYREWAMKECPKFCHFCKASTTISSTTASSTTKKTQESRSCSSSPSDIIILLDTKFDTIDDFNLQKSFLIKFIDGMDYGDQKVQIGVAMTSSSNDSRVYLNQYHTKSDVLAKIIMLPYQQNRINSSKGMAQIIDEMFSAFHGDRQHVPNIVVLITDGHNGKIQPNFVQQIQQNGVTVLVITVGRNASFSLVEDIVTTQADAFHVDTISDIMSISNTFKRQYCTVIKRTCEDDSKSICRHPDVCSSPTSQIKCRSTCKLC